MRPFASPSCRIDPLPQTGEGNVSVDVLRLDLVHPIISGNKWFKLSHYLARAKETNKILITFGGAYSNHIVATAFAGKEAGLKSIGVIRGEEARALSQTLTQARELGMELFFTSRENYKTKQIPEVIACRYLPEELCIIPEGGYGLQGMEGAKAILETNRTAAYTHVLSAVGTGTTLAGLVAGSQSYQRIIGISVFKNNHSLQGEIERLLSPDKKDRFELLHDYHFGGYAKQTPELIRFMNTFCQQTGIPTDFVYTGKAFFAAFDLMQKKYFGEKAKVLLIHTGGLQGNRSLPKGTLIFG